MTFAAVGSLIQATGASTFSLTPAGVGHLILIEVINTAGTGNESVATSLSSSNVTWSVFGTSYTSTSLGWTAQVFAGKVTAASVATVTITWSGTSPGTHVNVAGHEYSSTVGAWALDVQGHIDTTGTNTWASLTPAASGELYFGYAINATEASAGSTSGYTYATDSNSNGVAWNAACTASAQAPVWADSGQQLGIMVLVKETGAAAAAPYPALRQAVRARVPQGRHVGGFFNGYGTDSFQAAGSVMWNGGAPVNNPKPGPVFLQRTSPVRFTLPPPHPRAGRIGSSFGTVAQAPAHGPPVYPQKGPVRPRIPRGRIAGAILDGFSGPSLPGALNGSFGGGMGSGGAPVRNPVPGPVFYQKTSPAKAQNPLPKRGRISSNPGGPVQNPAPPGTGPAFRQATSPARIRPAAPPRGRTASNGGAPVKNPSPGPVFRQATYPVQFQMDRTGFPRGRTYSTRVAQVSQPAPPPTGPAFQQASQAIRAKLPHFPQSGSILDGSKSAAVPGPLNGAGFGGGIGSGGAPVKNPSPGPLFRQAVRAFRAQVALRPRAGRITGISQGGPVNNPIPPTEYLFIGHYAVEYPDYVDVNTDEMLICIPNQMYLMTVVQNRYGLTIPPPDGRWLGETEQPDEAVLVNPAHRATIEMAMARKHNAELQARSARGERITLAEEKPDDDSG